MKNKGNEIKDKVKKYIKENPVALFSTICVLFALVFLSRERVLFPLQL